MSSIRWKWLLVGVVVISALITAIIIFQRDEWIELKSQVEKLSTEGQYVEAEQIARRMLQIAEQRDHKQEIATSLNELAIALFNQRKYEEAETQLNRTLKLDEYLYGRDNNNSAIVLQSLGRLYHDQKNLSQSEYSYNRALSMYEKVLQPNHPQIASCLNGLSLLYAEQNKVDEAIPLQARAMELQEKAFGEEDISVGKSATYLARLYFRQKRYADADRLFKRALTIQEKHLGASHVDVAEICFDMAINNQFRGDKQASGQLYDRAMKILERNNALPEVLEKHRKLQAALEQQEKE